MPATPFLTAKRLRAHGVILAICLWSVYVWNISTPGLLDRAGNLKGNDFLHFYTLGSLALTHRGGDLYNMQAQSALAAQRVPAAAGIRYLPLYPPQVSLFFAPFARFSYSVALVLWLAFSAALYAGCCYAIWRACPNLRNQKLTVAILAFAFPAFWHLIAWGQTSSLAMICFTLAFFALRAQWNFLAGAALGCLIFKPQLGLAAALVFLFALNWKLIAGTLFSSLAQIAAAWLYYGPGPLREWMNLLRNTPNILRNSPNLLRLLEPRPYQTHCLRTFWSMLIPLPSVSSALYIASALVVLLLTVACWRSRLSLSLRYSALLLATVLVAPHLTVYDLVIIAPVFLLVSDWIVAQPTTSSRHLPPLLYLAFALPLLGPLTRWAHIQLSVPVMAALLYWIWKLSRKKDEKRSSIVQSS